MAILVEANGAETIQCDGCGRTDAGPGRPIDAVAYTVADPNIGTAVRHYYCPSCSYERGSNSSELLTFDWPTLPVAVEEAE